MTPALRLLWGSLLGALVVLIIHPSSRPYYALFTRQLGPSTVLSTSPWMESNVKKVVPPTNRQEAAYFLVIVSRQYLGLRDISVAESQYAADLARQCSSLDPTNAFWLQMASVFDRSGKFTDWEIASNGTRWDDGQNSRLLFLSASMSKEYNTTMPWQNAALLNQRSSSHALAILRHARTEKVERDAPLESLLATLRNGQLILEGGRSIEVASIGAVLMQQSASGRESADTGSYSERLRQRQRFVDRLRAANMPGDAATVEAAYRNADSWSNVVDTAGNRRDRAERQIWSVIAASLPGCFVHIALLGIALMLLGYGLGFHKISHGIFSFPVAPILGLGIGTAIYAATWLVWPSLWAVLSLAFFVFQPTAVRSRLPEGLSGNHRIVIVIVGLVLASCYGLFIAGLGAPMRAIGPEFNIPQEYQAGSSLLLGSSLFSISIAVFSAPIWALIHKYEPVQLLKVVFVELGKGLLTTGLAASIVSTPICIFINRSLEGPISKTLLNEPNLHLTE